MAYVLVNLSCLLRKLFHYGFSNNSLLLLQDYFSDRGQKVLFKRVKSEEVCINIPLNYRPSSYPYFSLMIYLSP